MRIAIPREPDPRAFARRQSDAPIVTLAGETMGTGWSAQIVVPAVGETACQAAIITALDDIVAQMSHWEPSSALCRINRAPAGSRHRLDPGFAEVIAAALDLWTTSDGAFEPAIGALVDLWGFGPPGPVATVPDDDSIARALSQSGAARLTWEAGSRILTKTGPVQLDLSGIAKGYAVDAVAAVLRTLGASDFLIEIGGEYVGSGIRPDGQPWWVDVESPPGMAAPDLRIALHNHAVATSGDYRRAFEASGELFSHSIDPRTGRPITNGVVQVSVLHDNCMMADGWASALTVLGPEAGMDLAKRHSIAAHMLLRDGREHLSPALSAMV